MNRIRIYGKYSFSMLVLLMILCSGLPLAFAGMDDWTMFRHDPANTGWSTSTAPDSSKLLWSYKTGKVVPSSPAVANGRVYVGSFDNKTYCLDAVTGAHIWNYTTGGNVYSSPAVADGRVYVGSWDDKVYCLDADTGVHIWDYTTGGNVHSSPAVADGRVYVGSWDDKVYCLDADTGVHIWDYTTGGNVHSSPAVADGRIYVSSDDDKVYCLDADTGVHIWDYTTGGCVESSPAVADGRVYVGSYDYKVYCLGSSITLDDIMNELQALRDIEAEVDTIEIKLDSILDRLGLPPVGGSIVLKEELSYILNLISENLVAVTLIITAAIVYLLLAKRMSYWKFSIARRLPILFYKL
jgi:outer membrane protein assembly factor BamB